MVNIYELSEAKQHCVGSVDEPTLTTFTSAQCSMTSEYHNEMDEQNRQMMPVNNFVIPDAAVDKMYVKKLSEPYSSSTYYDFWNTKQHAANVQPFCTYTSNGGKDAKQKQSEAFERLEAEKLRQVVIDATAQTKIDQDQSAMFKKQLEETRRQTRIEQASALVFVLFFFSQNRNKATTTRVNLEWDQIFSSLMMMSISNHMNELGLDIAAKDALLAEQSDKYEIFREQSGILQAQLDLRYSESLNGS